MQPGRGIFLIREETMARDWTSILARAKEASEIIWDNRKGFAKYNALEVVGGKRTVASINYAEALEGFQSLVQYGTSGINVMGVFVIKNEIRHFILAYDTDVPVSERPCAFTLFCWHKLSHKRHSEIRQKQLDEYMTWRRFCRGFEHHWLARATRRPHLGLIQLTFFFYEIEIDPRDAYETALNFLFDSKFLTLGTFKHSNHSIIVYMMNERREKFVLTHYKKKGASYVPAKALSVMPWRRIDYVFFEFVMHILECASELQKGLFLDYDFVTGKLTSGESASPR